MDEKKETILEMKLAELQFRLAITVRLVSSLGRQPLEVPTQWAHGKHIVTYEEMVLTKDQLDIAADCLKRTATYLMSITIKDGLKKIYKDPKNHKDKNVVAAYQISRLIRNAFAHSPIRPVWSIDPDCRDREFVVEDIISLNTKGLDRKPLDWRHYGGLLALFRLSKFVRINLFGDTDTGKNRKLSKQDKKIYQQGNLILQEIEKLPDGVKKIDFPSSIRKCNA
jgi:hypothetical protein